MKRLTVLMTFAFIAGEFLSSAQAQQTRIAVIDEIRYPTAWQEQSVESMISSQYRTPIPENFETRQVGTILDVGAVGAVGKAVIIRNPPLVYHVVFPDGREARFSPGRVTVVRGVPYRGLGMKNGYFRVMNLNTLQVLRFRMPGARDS